ncbi:MAG: hypothetical protein IAG13_03490 [Deltaproteobacteria bacterium]|nr:hypothetical protein [Nannocystaceae bacterium]
MTNVRLIALFATGTSLALACDANQSSNDDEGGASSLTMSGGGNDESGSESGSEGGSEGGEGPSTDPSGSPTTDPGDTGESADTGSEGGEVMIDAENMIDDLEDGDAVIYARNGRQGAWYTYNDASTGGVQNPEAMTSFTPTEGGTTGSPLFMAHSDGAGFSEWGFGVGVDLNNEGDDMGGPGLRMPYDAGAHTGVVFTARGDVSIRLKILVEAIVPADAGGTCAEMCEDAHGKLIPLTGEWVQYVVPFSDLFQEGWGFGEVDLDPATLMSIQFQVAKSTDGMLEIDELAFY